MTRTRAERIANRKRMIKRRVVFYHHVCGIERETAFRLGKLTADNRQPCSCNMCGHKREWIGETVQERRNVMEYEV